MKTVINSIGRISHYLVIPLFSILLVYGCSKSSSIYGNPNPNPNPGPTKGSNAVVIQNMAFNPASLTVSANTTVTWTNKDAIAHTVTSDTGLFDSGSLGSGGTFSYTFTQTGTYSYHCAIHTYMTAKIIVQ